MPREIVRKPRLIYPQIATSLSIAQLSVLAELLFWRILPQADDQGRLPGDPRQLKALACPMRDELTPDKIGELLSELEQAELIIQYSNSSKRYIQIAQWWDYQSGMRHIYPSRYPPPDGWQDRVKGAGVGKMPVGKMPQNSAEFRLKPEPEEEEEEPEPESVEPEPEEEVTATPATEIATESRTAPAETLEAQGREAGTAELELLSFLETLEGWRFGRAEDLAWLKEFRQEYPEFTLSLAKACRDYHSGRAPPRHKGHWKNRFREWMKHERQFAKERGETGDKGQRVKGARPPSDFSSGKW